SQCEAPPARLFLHFKPGGYHRRERTEGRDGRGDHRVAPRTHVPHPARQRTRADRLHVRTDEAVQDQDAPGRPRQGRGLAIRLQPRPDRLPDAELRAARNTDRPPGDGSTVVRLAVGQDVPLSRSESWELFVLLGCGAPFFRNQLSVARHGGSPEIALTDRGEW